MLTCRLLVMAACVLVLAGCGSGLAGTYQGDARLISGKEESTEPGCSLAEVQARVRAENRTLTLERGGRFVWNTGDAVNEGDWRVEGSTLFLREDTSNGVHIQPALRKDRKWDIGEDGVIVNTGAYRAYNLEEIYTRR